MGVGSWIKERLGLGALFDHLIPSHANSPAYVLGGTLLVVGLAQGITGVLLQQFYQPMPNANVAYDSVRFIKENQPWGFFRNLHYWGSQLILVIVVLHMLRVYIAAAYKRPRELLWVSGVLLLVLAWLLAFTGSVLKWDQEGVEALVHNLEFAGFAGPLGYWFDPSFAPDVPILIRVNSAHVTLLPLITLIVVGLHVYMIRVLGISSPKTEHARTTNQVPFSTHITRMVIYGSIAMGLVVILAIVVNAPLTSIGNTGIEISKPDWYLLWIYTIENYWGLEPVPYILSIAMILMVIAPAMDRGSGTDPRRRKLMISLLVIAVLLFVALTISAALLPPKSHLE